MPKTWSIMLVSPSNKSLKMFEGSTSNMENPDNLVEKRESIPHKSAVERFQEEPTFALNMLTVEVGFGVWLKSRFLKSNNSKIFSWQKRRREQR